jgi:hypothetical protein
LRLTKDYRKVEYLDMNLGRYAKSDDIKEHTIEKQGMINIVFGTKLGHSPNFNDSGWGLGSMLFTTPEEQLRESRTLQEQEGFSCVPTTRGTQKKCQRFQIVDGTLLQQKVTPDVPLVGKQAVDGMHGFHQRLQRGCRDSKVPDSGCWDMGILATL